MAEVPYRLAAALASRYTLEREVGAGGMATVYLALDPKHHRKVAVKVLRPDLAATLGPDRFLREIEIAAQLQHPHILPLLDSGEADGFLYYVMPYIEGESLRARLARQGELPISEAVRLLRDVTDALAYAHGRGVVHRDIKPDNVMISGRHALVTDFGVAKAVSEATGRRTMTTAGVALGTPAYMAPEQAAADPNIDHRADIYALGAMGYELVAGRTPFIGATPQQILAAQVTQAPEPVTVHREACPPGLAEVIMRCLAKRPADRWQTADELVDQLERLGTPSGGTTPASTAPTSAVAAPGAWYGHPLRVGGLFILASVAVLGVVYFLTIQLGLPDWVPWGALALLLAGLPVMVATGLIERRRARARATGRLSPSGETPLRRWFTWRKAIRNGLLAFAGLGSVTVAYTAMRLLGLGPVGTLVASGKLKARDRIVVADFQNRSTDSTLGPSVTEAFRIDLGQSPVIAVFSPAEIAAGLRRMSRDPAASLDPTAARELAQREGGKAYVAGEISQVGDAYLLSARLLSPADQSELVALRETADNAGGLLPAIDRLSRRMRERIGESLRSIRANPPLEKVTTSSLEALRLYTEGNKAATAGDNETAIRLLRQALAQDSGFAMAWRKLAVVLSNSFASHADVVDAATRAFRHRDRLPDIERRQTTAWYYFTVDVDLDKAASAYRSVLELNPDDQTALNNLAVILIHLRQYPEAERLAAHALQVGPGAPFFDNLAQAQAAQGKMKEARATLDQMEKATPGSPSRLFDLGGLLVVSRAYDSAQRVYQEIGLGFKNPSTRAGAAASLAMLAEMRGRLTEAERHYREFMALGEQRGLPGDYLWGATVMAQMQLLFGGDREAAARTVAEALKRHPLATMPAYDRPYTALAAYYALNGQADVAQRLMAEYTSAVPEGARRGNPYAPRARGYLALTQGRAAEAVTEFREWYDKSGCTNCALYELGTAFEAAHQPDSALAAYARAAEQPGTTDLLYTIFQTAAPNQRRLGELYEEKGDRQRALEYYGRFVNLWSGADPVLQPQVREIKQRMAKLAGEGK